MTVLYRILRQTLRYGLELYFVDIQAMGQETIPQDAPVIFAANHPNSIMDTVILGAQTRRQIHYMAKSQLFENPLVATLFNQCGVIPVYQAKESEADSPRNEDSFRRAYEVLEEDGCIGIFPEGQNSLERRVRDIKTGTARIALAAEAKNDFQLGLQIIPVGLNFENRDRFLSSVLVRFGRAINVSDYADAHRADPRAAVRALTDAVQEDIRQLATHIDDDRHHQLVRDINQIYGQELLSELIGDIRLDTRGMRDRLFDEVRATPGVKPDLDDRFVIEQYIADAVSYYQQHDPAMVARVRMDIRRYKDHMRQVRLHQDFLNRPPETLSRRKDSLKFTYYALVFGPLAVWGLINNFLPFKITRSLTMRAPDEAMRAITGFVTGMFAYPLFYAAQGWAIWHLSASWIVTLLYVLSLSPAGFFFLRYRRQIMRYRDRILARTMFRTRRNLIRQLMRERDTLIATFDTLKDNYMRANLPGAAAVEPVVEPVAVK
ncbi:MAG: 1-acyl-sn-glycerol-3-phosphate acyltransferase [Bradymonadaceae bacterium]|nr:1-acyl-sn-glycerol-3-phosphate acyltransferase [Lujinxingiaceae bacterium]